MARGMADLSWGMQKAQDAAALVPLWRQTRELGRLGRLRLLISGSRAILSNARVVPYLGHQFHYENRVQPAFLPMQLSDVRHLEKLVNLERATVLDVGANVGQFAAAVKWRFPAAAVWSFEPNPGIYPLLERNAAQSENWSTVPWGLAANDVDTSFWFVQGRSAFGSVFRENALTGMLGSQAIEQTVALRELTPARMGSLGIPSTVDILKLDVEGAEREALAGLASVRWRYLFIELSMARSGRLTADDAAQVINEVWGERPQLLWQSEPQAGGTSRDAIFSLATPAD